MSDEGLAWWLGGGTWYDRRQRRQIEDLQQSVSAETSRLRSRLSRVEGGLQTKVDAIARAFDAFVELSDIRSEMAVYTEAAIVRHQTRLLLAAVTDQRPVDAPDLPTVAGYWLVPATRALFAHLAGKPGGVARHTEAALAADADRTRYFLAAARRLAGPVDLTAMQLSELLPAPTDGPVSTAQRAFWVATAHGAFGDAGRALLASALSGALGRADDADDTRLSGWLARIGGDGGDARSARYALTGLCERYLTGTTATPVAAPPGEDNRLDTKDPALAPLIDLVRSLVDEGHEPERALLRRAERLRRTVQYGTATDDYRPWDAPVGGTAELVEADAFDDDADAPLRAVALRVSAPWLAAAAKRIATDGAEVTTEESSTVRIRGHQLRVDRNGADPATVARIRSDIDEMYRTTHRRVYAGGGATAVGLLLAAAGFAGVATALGVVGVLLAVAGVAYALVAWNDVRQRRAARQVERASLDRTVAREIAAHRDRLDRQAAQRAELSDAYTELARALA